MRKSLRAVCVAGLVTIEVMGRVGIVPGQTPSASPAPAASEADVSILRERAAAFWAARVAGNAEGQWQLLEPRGKGRMTAQEYGASPVGGRYLAYQVEDAVVEGYFARVKVRLLVQQVFPVAVQPRSVPPQAVLIDDGWIKIRGTWYRRMDAGANNPLPNTSGEAGPKP